MCIRDSFILTFQLWKRKRAAWNIAVLLLFLSFLRGLDVYKRQEDTSRLLDFGFNNFQSVKIADYDQTFSNIGKDLKIADVSTAGGESLSIDPDSRVVLPKTADFSETTTSFDYEIPAGAPDGTIACVTYSLGDHKAVSYTHLN